MGFCQSTDHRGKRTIYLHDTPAFSNFFWNIGRADSLLHRLWYDIHRRTTGTSVGESPWPTIHLSPDVDGTFSQRWEALRTNDELFVLIPIVNNLKGNLEMNLSARLGTAANMGSLRTRSTRQPLIKGNLLLLQVQALLVSAVAAALSFFLGIVAPSREKMPMEMPQDSTPDTNETTVANVTARIVWELVSRIPEAISESSELPLPVRTWGYRFREYVRSFCTSSSELTSTFTCRFFTVLTAAMASASMSGLILGSFMCSLVLLCQRYRLNPGMSAFRDLFEIV